MNPRNSITYSGHFLVHEAWLALSPSERSVFQVLYMHAGADRLCWPSVRTVERLSGMTYRNAQRILQQLASKGYISIEQQYHAGRNTTNCYKLLHID